MAPGSSIDQLLEGLNPPQRDAVTYGEVWRCPSAMGRIVCFALALPLGRIVARRKNWVTLLGGALAASVFFYLATNTDAWLRDPVYVDDVVEAFLRARGLG